MARIDFFERRKAFVDANDKWHFRMYFFSFLFVDRDCECVYGYCITFVVLSILNKLFDDTHRGFLTEHTYLLRQKCDPKYEQVSKSDRQQTRRRTSTTITSICRFSARIPIRIAILVSCERRFCNNNYCIQVSFSSYSAVDSNRQFYLFV